jgi:hypothetical protein
MRYPDKPPNEVGRAEIPLLRAKGGSESEIKNCEKVPALARVFFAELPDLGNFNLPSAAGCDPRAQRRVRVSTKGTIPSPNNARSLISHVHDLRFTQTKRLTSASNVF